MAVHAIEPRCDPPPARFQETDAQFRMAFAYAAPDHSQTSQHHFHGVGNDMTSAASLEPVDADLGHPAAGALVEADRKIKILCGCPERLVHGIVDHLVA